jgi:hypothetical protein
MVDYGKKILKSISGKRTIGNGKKKIKKSTPGGGT